METPTEDSEALLQDALDTLHDDDYDVLDSFDLNLSDNDSVNLLDDLDAALDLVDLDDEGGDDVEFPPTDLLEEIVTSARNGDHPLMTSVSYFTSMLSRTGIHGPRHLQPYNLKQRAVRIGKGAQFTVYKEISGSFFGNEGLVIKRVNVPLSRESTDSFASGSDYRFQLRALQLEILALCNPRLRAHRNIAQLAAWGYDYPMPDTPVPALFMEAALMTLTDFLTAENEHLLGQNPLDVKHALALDVTAGIEALHSLRIVHGDVKPDNVLVFPESGAISERVPFCAKISDFGVCVDLESSDSKLTIDDYRGTPAWIAPEVRDPSRSRWVTASSFTPELMFRFDAYSLGLVILSVFVNRGEPISFTIKGESPIDMALHLLRKDQSISSPLRTQLSKALRSLLAEDPSTRGLPSPDLLKSDSPIVASWTALSQDTRKASLHAGTIDPIYNKGPRFWYRLDPAVLKELEQQFVASQTDLSLCHAGDVLLGMAQSITGAKPSYADRLITYLTESARSGYSPSRALYAQIVSAHNRKSEFDDATLDKWLLRAVSEGYMLAKPSSRITEEELATARQTFRDRGGFCTDPFTRKPDIMRMARERSLVVEKWDAVEKKVVDNLGNTILHVASALGALDVVRYLVEDVQMPIDILNDNDESPLYKACQAGQANVILYLLHRGASASIATRQDQITALHWLFTIPGIFIREIATRLVREAGASINALMVPDVGKDGGRVSRRLPMLHFPFELPLGTPFHWAAFARSRSAVEVLLDLGADINAMYIDSNSGTTPLTLASWCGDVETVQFLLSRGADGKATDPKGRNMLHLMTFEQLETYSSSLQAWHYWIRHGAWEEHLRQITQLTRLLIEAGAGVEERDQVYPRATPIVRAAEAAVWNGGLTCALLDAAADINEARGASKDTVLHMWAAATGPRLAYPSSYLYIMERVISNTKDVDIPNDFVEETPLHVLTTIYHSEDEFEATTNILFAHDRPPDVNRPDRHGLTPLLIALDTEQVEQNPERRALCVISHGAALSTRTRTGGDIFFRVASNKTLSDQRSHDLILRLLSRVADQEEEKNRDPEQVYQKYYLSQPGAIQALDAAASAGRIQTTALLLDLGLEQIINISVKGNPPLTVLDNALTSAENSRHMHMDLLAAYSPGAPRTRALAANTVYDPRQGGPSRAAEAYQGHPEVLSLLRTRGAKRAHELGLLTDPVEIDLGHPDVWDITHIYWIGFTPETQPNRQAWGIVYQLSRSFSPDWRDHVVKCLREMYENETWRPDLEFLQRAAATTVGQGSSPSHKGVTDGTLVYQLLSMLVTLGGDGGMIRQFFSKLTTLGQGDTGHRSNWIKFRDQRKYDRAGVSVEDEVAEVELVEEIGSPSTFKVGGKRTRGI